MEVILHWTPQFLLGAGNTLIYCAASFPLAILLGLLLALMKESPFTWLRTPAKIFIEIFRGTPMITQLFLLYYGIGAILVRYNLSSLDNYWTAGIVSLALNYAAYEAEIFRAGFLSVDRGQTEAAYSLGLSAGQSFFRIKLPQAIPLMIPPFVNDFIYMLKDSAILSVISATELTSVMQRSVFVNSSSANSLFLLGLILYLILSLPISYVARFFERRLRAAL
ncbi:MAG TPA: amino acid ABC transporter permease [Ktedonobacteraceae bacterium]|jgi:His/Glu/Gln/Arg/opine family amino acid ABC transporter permease subunit